MSARYSISPISGSRYVLPQSNTSTGLTKFLDSNKSKRIVAVQGLGFVGTAMSLVVANNNEDQYAVIGVDRGDEDSYWKIEDINNGLLPLVSSDPLVEKFFRKARDRNNFYATYDTDAFSKAEIIIVDINLDVTKSRDEEGNLTSYDVPMDGFKNAIRTIGSSCKEDVLVLVETTVPPGTCRKIVHPLLVDCFESRGMAVDRFKLGHSYERVMPGPNYIDSIKNFYRVYSGINTRSADAVEHFLRTIIETDEYPLTRLQSTEATEMAKVLENSFRAMNISFMVEWSRFAELAGVDLYSVIDAIRLRPTHANLMYPGIGVGGYCLTKDPIMASWASEKLFDLDEGLPSSKRAVEINDLMPQSAFNFLKNSISEPLGNLHFGLLGVAYGPGIGDTRFSPVETFAKRLLSEGAELSFFDPYVSYWQELNREIAQTFEDIRLASPSILVISTGHSYFVKDNAFYEYLKRLEQAPILFDMVGLLDRTQLDSRYSLGNNLFVLGVGNP